MPLVRISLVQGRPPVYIRAIADGVHLALAEAFDVPADDRFQLITQHAPDELIYDSDYLGIHRTDDIVVINIVASSGRDTVKKQALFRAIADNLARDPGLRPEDVMVVLSPNARDDWSFGRGLASYVRTNAAA